MRVREKAGGRLPGFVQDGLTGGVGGETWRPDYARMTRIGDALADRPRVRHGLSAGRVTWQ